MKCFVCGADIKANEGVAMPGDMWVCDTCYPIKGTTSHPEFNFKEIARHQHQTDATTLVVTMEIPIKDYTQLLLYKRVIKPLLKH